MRRSRPQTVGYKGRAYRLLWRGVVKKGKNAGKEMAHLGFMSGDGDFWITAERLEAPPLSRRQCPECELWDGQHDITCALN